MSTGALRRSQFALNTKRGPLEGEPWHDATRKAMPVSELTATATTGETVPTILPTSAVARLLNRSPRQVRRDCAQGRIPGALRLGPHAWAVPLREVEVLALRVGRCLTAGDVLQALRR